MLNSTRCAGIGERDSRRRRPATHVVAHRRRAGEAIVGSPGAARRAQRQHSGRHGGRNAPARSLASLTGHWELRKDCLELGPWQCRAFPDEALRVDPNSDYTSGRIHHGDLMSK